MKILTNLKKRTITAVAVLSLILQPFVGVISVYAATTSGTELFPGTVTSVSVPGLAGWSNAGRAVSDNGQYASTNLNSGDNSEYLKATNYGFDIPSGVVVDGITVSIDRSIRRPEF